MILLVDACACPDRVAEAATAAPPGVTVVTVTEGRDVRPRPAVHRARRYARWPTRPAACAPTCTCPPGPVPRPPCWSTGTALWSGWCRSSARVEDYRADLARLAG